MRSQANRIRCKMTAYVQLRSSLPEYIWRAPKFCHSFPAPCVSHFHSLFVTSTTSTASADRCAQHSLSFLRASRFTLVYQSPTQRHTGPSTKYASRTCRDHSASHRARSSENNLLICSLRPPRQLHPPAYSPRCSRDNLPPHSRLYSWINNPSDRRERVLGRATFM